MSATTRRILCGIGSAVVVLCFFLPMSQQGGSAFQGVVGIFRVFGMLSELGGAGGQVVLAVVLSLLLVYLLTPLICHLIAGIRILSGGKPSGGLTITPVAVWLALLILALVALKSAEAEMGLSISAAHSFGLGFIGTWLGMLLAMIVALIRPVEAAPAWAPPGGQYAPTPPAQSGFCSQCGQPVSAGDQFCPGCGARRE